MRKKRSIEERFWPKVDRSRGPNECWLWTGSLTKFGYGQINLGSRGLGPTRAHRASWIIHNGPVPDGMYVLHECPAVDNKRCVNPAHLKLGTHAENMRDASQKGQMRPAIGAASPRARLTEEHALAIRRAFAQGASKADLARKYKVNPMTIHAVVVRKTWRHI